MSPAGRVSDYPWGALEALPRSLALSANHLRRRVRSALDLATLPKALSELLTADVDLVTQKVAGPEAARELPSAEVCLVSSDGKLEITVAAEPALACVALARVLHRPVHLSSPDAPLGPVLSGAWSALVVEAARRAGNGLALRLGSPATSPPDSEGLTVVATLLLDGRPYSVGARVRATPSPTGNPGCIPSLDELGDLPIALPLVVGMCRTTPSELESLEPGDAWTCGEGWLLRSGAIGRGALAAPGGEHGVAVDVVDSGDLVLRGETVDLMVDLAAEAIMTDSNDPLGQSLLDAPVVVRVELGSVSMTAREWADLGPGDVILAGRRIAEPAVLRVGGRDLAHGELVSVDGELGVRIQQITRREPEE